MRTTLPINAISGVAVGGVAQIPLSGKRRIHGIKLQYGNTGSPTPTRANMEADITLLTLMVDGKPRRTCTLAELNKIRIARGLLITSGLIEIDFSDPNARDIDGEEKFALNTFRLGDVTLNVTIAGTASAPTLVGTIIYDEFDDKNDTFVEWLKLSVPSSGAAEQDYATLPRTGAYLRVHLISALVTAVRVFRGSTEVMSRSDVLNRALLNDYGLVPEASHFVVAADFTRQITDALVVTDPVDRNNPGGPRVPVDQFLLKYTASGAGSIPAIAEHVIDLVRAA